jgi:ABC-type nitrate/sulfonate/bicarbonate transport system permease component
MAGSIDAGAAEISLADSSGLDHSGDIITEETWWERNERMVLGSGFIFLFLFLWEIGPLILPLSAGMKLFFATPTDIVASLYRMFSGDDSMFLNGNIWDALAHSANAFLLGLGFGILVGLPLGVVLGRSETINAMIDPFITSLNATPRLVFLPMVLMWFGIGLWSEVLIVFIGAVFPMLINTYAGVRNADRLLINVVRSFGASEWEINKLVVLPNSIPFIIAGLRLAIGRAILGVVVAEFFGGAEAGIGVMMVNAAGKYHVDVLFAGLFIFMVQVLILTSIVKVMELRLSRWRPEKVKTF